MKKILRPFAEYNVWANKRVTDCILTLPEQQLHLPIISSFPSIHKTLLHMLDAESMWWQRLKLVESVERPSDTFNGTTPELISALLLQSALWKDWIEQATEAALEHEFIYRNTRKEQFKQPVFEVAQHLFNHQSYHRGQLITVLRQAGLNTIPNTDMIQFYRKNPKTATAANRDRATTINK